MTTPINVKGYSKLLKVTQIDSGKDKLTIKLSNLSKVCVRGLLKVLRQYKPLIVKITNLIDYYYTLSNLSNILYYILLLVIGGSIAGILGVFIYNPTQITQITQITQFTPVSEIYTMILNSITTHTGAIT